jgi:hypothetical protein
MYVHGDYDLSVDEGTDKDDEAEDSSIPDDVNVEVG